MAGKGVEFTIDLTEAMTSTDMDDLKTSFNKDALEQFKSQIQADLIEEMNGYRKEREALRIYTKNLRICMIGWFKPQSDIEMQAFEATLELFIGKGRKKITFDKHGQNRARKKYVRYCHKLREVENAQ